MSEHAFCVHGPHDHEVEHRSRSIIGGPQSLTLLQIAIALAAIALLTRRRWLQWMAHGAAAASAVVGVLALARVRRGVATVMIQTLR